MTRDWELIREILTKLEQIPSTQELVEAGDFGEDRAELASYQMNLLIDAGLIEGKCSRS